MQASPVRRNPVVSTTGVSIHPLPAVRRRIRNIRTVRHDGPHQARISCREHHVRAGTAGTVRTGHRRRRGAFVRSRQADGDAASLAARPRGRDARTRIAMPDPGRHHTGWRGCGRERACGGRGLISVRPSRGCAERRPVRPVGAARSAGWRKPRMLDEMLAREFEEHSF